MNFRTFKYQTSTEIIAINMDMVETISPSKNGSIIELRPLADGQLNHHFVTDDFMD